MQQTYEIQINQKFASNDVCLETGYWYAEKQQKMMWVEKGDIFGTTDLKKEYWIYKGKKKYF